MMGIISKLTYEQTAEYDELGRIVHEHSKGEVLVGDMKPADEATITYTYYGNSTENYERSIVCNNKLYKEFYENNLMKLSQSFDLLVPNPDENIVKNTWNEIPGSKRYFEYNENGKIIKISNYEGDILCVYDYDDKGRMIHAVLTDTETIHEYDDHDNEIRNYIKIKNNECIKEQDIISKYTYDDKGRILSYSNEDITTETKLIQPKRK